MSKPKPTYEELIQVIVLCEGALIYDNAAYKPEAERLIKLILTKAKLRNY